MTKKRIWVLQYLLFFTAWSYEVFKEFLSILFRKTINSRTKKNGNVFTYWEKIPGPSHVPKMFKLKTYCPLLNFKVFNELQKIARNLLRKKKRINHFLSELPWDLRNKGPFLDIWNKIPGRLGPLKACLFICPTCSGKCFDNFGWTMVSKALNLSQHHLDIFYSSTQALLSVLVRAVCELVCSSNLEVASKSSLTSYFYMPFFFVKTCISFIISRTCLVAICRMSEKYFSSEKLIIRWDACSDE